HRYNNSRVPVMLETFKRLSYFPEPLVKAMTEDLLRWKPNVTVPYVQGQVPCLWLDDERSFKAKFTFIFKTEPKSKETPSEGDVRIEVPVTDLVYRTSGLEGDQCFLGVVEAVHNKAALGTNILKRGYWVFDWENRTVRVAKNADCGSRAVRWETEGGKVIGGCGGGKKV
ncbi:hypothetical protein QBC40DRAFT_143665, partial [Triangularia verruculosa]